MTQVRDNAAAGRFEMEEGGHIVFADYRRVGGRLIIDHVEAPPVLRGTGAAGRFMEGLAAEARATGEKIVPLCGYAAAWLHRHTQHRDLVA
ncbi:MAG: N-acetyltransferase [Caulobacteraceae bacterium]|jgi:predicted GNAT family acetyltransferase|nr:N-acetyltransferase [Caulobacteraceae bacterium]